MNARPSGRTDWAKLASQTDEDIGRAVAENPDAAILDMDWSKAKVYFPKGKIAISLRVDPEVHDYFKSTGKGFQTRMNAVLRAFVDHQRVSRSGK